MQQKIRDDQQHDHDKSYDVVRHLSFLSHPYASFPREKLDQADAYSVTHLDEDCCQMLLHGSILNQFLGYHVLNDHWKFLVLFHLHALEILCRIQVLQK